MILTITGVLLALGSAVIFFIVGLLALFSGNDATKKQIIPGFRPDNPSLVERVLTLLGVWGPIVLIVLLCLLAGVQIIRVALMAL